MIESVEIYEGDPESGAGRTTTLVPRTVPPAAGIPLPPGNFMQIKHDREAMDDRQRVGYPEVYPLHLAQYCDLTEPWQWFWFRAGLVHPFTGYKHWDEKRLTRIELNMLKGKWESLTKTKEAFTNKKGTDLYADYINGNGLYGLPGQEPLACCGNIVKVLGGPYTLAGKKLMKIETLAGNRPPPPIEKVNRLLTPHVVFCFTNVAAWKDENGKRQPFILSDGSYRVDPAPQLAPLDTLVLLRTNGQEARTYERNGVWYAENYILESRLKPVTGTIVPSPYNL